MWHPRIRAREAQRLTNSAAAAVLQNRWALYRGLSQVLGDYVAVGTRTQCAHNARSVRHAQFFTTRRRSKDLRRVVKDSARTLVLVEDVVKGERSEPCTLLWGPKVYTLRSNEVRYEPRYEGVCTPRPPQQGTARATRLRTTVTALRTSSFATFLSRKVVLEKNTRTTNKRTTLTAFFATFFLRK